MPAPQSPCTIEALYNDHHPWLAEWLRHKLSNTADAADLAHDAFLRVIKGRDMAQVREPRSYLATIARGLVIDLFRRRSLEAQYQEVMATQPEATWPSEETRALVIETLLQFDAMLEGLGPKVRQVFILSQFEGLPYPLIAQRLGLSLRSVNNYMAHAIEHCCLFELQNNSAA